MDSPNIPKRLDKGFDLEVLTFSYSHSLLMTIRPCEFNNRWLNESMYILVSSNDKLKVQNTSIHKAMGQDIDATLREINGKKI